MGKFIGNLIFVLLVELLIVPVAMVLFHVDVPDGWPAMLAVIDWHWGSWAM